MSDEWDALTFRDIANFTNGYPFKPADLQGSNLPVIRIKQLLDSGAETDFTDLAVPEQHLIADGDLIFSWSGTLASKFWNRGPAALNQHLFRVTAKSGSDIGWVHLALDHAIEELSTKSHGTTMKHITKGVLESHGIVRPPLPEQRRIVDLMTHLDNHIVNLGNEILKVERLLISARDQLLEPQAEWSTLPLVDATVKIGSGATPRGGESAYREDGISLIRSQNVYDMRFEWEGLAHISDEQAKQLEGVTVQPNDVLLNITGASVNRCCKVPDEVLPARVNQHVAILRVDPELLFPDLLVHLLRRSQTKANLDQMAGSGTTRQALTKAQIEQTEIAVPSINEQRRVLMILSSLGETLTTLSIEMENAKLARSALLHDLLAGMSTLNEQYDSFLKDAS